MRSISKKIIHGASIETALPEASVATTPWGSPVPNGLNLSAAPAHKHLGLIQVFPRYGYCGLEKTLLDYYFSPFDEESCLTVLPIRSSGAIKTMDMRKV